MTINKWIDQQLSNIASRLPNLVATNPASFQCGRDVGYKQALLDLEKIIEEGAILSKSKCWCNDKYHEHGAICL